MPPLPFARALAAPAATRPRMNVGIRLCVGMTARAPPLGPLAGAGHPPGSSSLDVLNVCHHLNVRRVDTPSDPATVVAFESWRDRPSHKLIENPVGLPDAALNPDVSVSPTVSRADPLPAASDCVGQDFRNDMWRDPTKHGPSWPFVAAEPAD